MGLQKPNTTVGAYLQKESENIIMSLLKLMDSTHC